MNGDEPEQKQEEREQVIVYGGTMKGHKQSEEQGKVGIMTVWFDLSLPHIWVAYVK